MHKNLAIYAPIPLRLMLALGFLVHGLPKLGAKRELFVGVLTGIGIPYPEMVAVLVALLEVLGAVALLLGVFVKPVAVLLIIDMVVAIATVHWPHGFNFIRVLGPGPDGRMLYGFPGYEPNLFYIACLLSLILSGPGPFSLGTWLKARSQGDGPPRPI